VVQALDTRRARLFVAIEQAGTLDKTQGPGKMVAMKIPSILPGGELTFPASSGSSRMRLVVQRTSPIGSAPIIAPADSRRAGRGANPNCGK